MYTIEYDVAVCHTIWTIMQYLDIVDKIIYFVSPKVIAVLDILPTISKKTETAGLVNWQ